AAAVEGQRHVIAGADATIDAEAAYAGGSAALDRLDDRWSRIDLEVGMTAPGVDGVAVGYELHDAPVGAIGTTVVAIEVPAEAFVPLMLGNHSQYVDPVVEYVDGLVRISGEFADGRHRLEEIRLFADEGLLKSETVRLEIDGVDALQRGEVSGADWCVTAGLETVLEDLAVRDGAMHARWRIDGLDVADLAGARCMR
ncbi:MAG: hypothetical protein GXX90_06120, partial [Microbacteriaceae bacterium]|nr:hypothetical protein [Microbacteriaceae bacterium]